MTVKNNGDLKINFKSKEFRFSLLFFAIMKLSDILNEIDILFHRENRQAHMSYNYN